MVRNHLCCTAGHPLCVCVCVCVSTYSRPVNTDAVSKEACIISEGNGWGFLKWIVVGKKSQCMSFSVNGPCSSTPRSHTLSLLEQASPRGSCCICIWVNVFKPSPWRVIQSLICKDVMEGKGNPIVYYRVTDDWPTTRQTLRPESFSSWIPSFCPHWPLEQEMSPHSALCRWRSTKAGGRYSWPVLRQTQRLPCRMGELSLLETLNQCCQVSYEEFALSQDLSELNGVWRTTEIWDWWTKYVLKWSLENFWFVLKLSNYSSMTNYIKVI